MSTDFFSAAHDWADAEHHIEQAHDYYDKGLWSDALGELQAAIEINPANADWHFNKALTLDSMGRFSEAVDAYLEAHELAPDDVEILNSLGVDYTRLGQYDLALHAFEKIVEIDSGFEPAYCNRIITYAELGRHDDAEEMFYLARQIKEQCPFCYYNMGNSLFSRQLYERAIWCWQQTRSLSPDHPHINYRIGQAYWANGQKELARQSMLAELRNHPGNIDVLLDTGHLLLEMNQLEGAREKFNRILELDEQNCYAHHALGELLLHEGKVAPAMDCFRRALEFEPLHPGSHYRLGDCYFRLGQTANAREHLLLELELGPKDADLLLDMGCLLERVDQSHRAMQCFERVLTLKPNDPRGHHHLSLSYFQAGMYAEGIELAQQTLELEEAHLPALQNLALAHGKLKQYDEALSYLGTAATLAPEDKAIVKLTRQYRLARTWQKVQHPLRALLSKKEKQES